MKTKVVKLDGSLIVTSKQAFKDQLEIATPNDQCSFKDGVETETTIYLMEHCGDSQGTLIEINYNSTT